VSPDVTPPKDKVGTSNAAVVQHIQEGYQGSGSAAPAASGGGGGEATLKDEIAHLRAEKEHMAAEINDLKKQTKRLALEKKVLIMASAVANKQVIANHGVDNQGQSKACSVM
jgi:hypothetical protein